MKQREIQLPIAPHSNPSLHKSADLRYKTSPSLSFVIPRHQAPTTCSLLPRAFHLAFSLSRSNSMASPEPKRDLVDGDDLEKSISLYKDVVVTGVHECASSSLRAVVLR